MEENYRNLCQVFTPTENVKELLEWCDYRENLYGKKVMENSCGDGHILQEVVRRYIEDCLKNKFSTDKIKDGLNNDIYGIEYDQEQYHKCKKNLNIILEQYNIGNIEWTNVIHDDALKSKNKQAFDFVVGNPPYIKYKSLSLEDREYIRENFETCKKGKFDYCYAFIENSIKSLKDNGKMAYLIPSSIFKNVFANDLRKFIKPHITKIYDYTVTKLFDKNTNDKGTDRLVSSVIMIAEKNSNSNYLEYVDVTQKTMINIEKSNLNDKWIFKEKLTAGEKKRRFGDYFTASNTIATLYNNAYVIKDYTENDRYINPKIGGMIEKEVLKDTISPKTFNKGINEKIIFPYYYNTDNELVRYNKNEFEENFPNACKYLKKFQKELKERKSDTSSQWFEYGRSQALRNSNQEKILLSTVITNKVNTQILPADNIPYSGIYITKKSNKTLEYANKILTSKNFYEYLCSKGINASGNSIRITARDINEYMF